MSRTRTRRPRQHDPRYAAAWAGILAAARNFIDAVDHALNLDCDTPEPENWDMVIEDATAARWVVTSAHGLIESVTVGSILEAADRLSGRLEDASPPDALDSLAVAEEEAGQVGDTAVVVVA